MKKIVVILFAVFITGISSFTITKHLASGIHGMITPPDGAAMVWAASEKDSVSAVPVSGNFSLNVKPGKWRLHIVTVSPYKDAFIENVLVEENKYTDVGEIRLKGVGQ